MILHHWDIGQNMPSKYATTSYVLCDETIHYDIIATRVCHLILPCLDISSPPPWSSGWGVGDLDHV